jgi:anti-sigma regulatory factor (Ser/Thr protein kinase)
VDIICNEITIQSHLPAHLIYIMKRESKIVDGTPNKRLFWSIISDYSLNTSICELVDNALDIWIKNKKNTNLEINIQIDKQNHTIRIEDNAGGVPEKDLNVLISPGTSLNDPSESIIGMFGVGSKRAVVALAQSVRIKTRNGNNKTFQIDVDDEWLESDLWDMPVYEINDISPNTTIISLTSLRIGLSESNIRDLKSHLRETYSQFLKEDNFGITLNSEELIPQSFDRWAYPPDFEPRYYMFEIKSPDGESVGVEIYAGLIWDRDPIKENYGVYFYCNDRLIIKEVKDREVGYLSGYAGIPHPDASLTRVIVKFYGPARLMPWNSSKSSVNYNHFIFKELNNVLLPIVKDFSSLSRRLKDDWENKVFQYKYGDMKHLDLDDIDGTRKSYLPPLPKVRKKKIDHLKDKNSEILKEKPWTLGLLESLAAQDLIFRQKLETKNRIALILLDSTFEIALKEFIVHTDGIDKRGRTLEEIFKNRDEVISLVKQKVDIPQNVLRRVKHFYQLRNKLIHERATVGIADSDISNFRQAINECLSILFDIES